MGESFARVPLFWWFSRETKGENHFFFWGGVQKAGAQQGLGEPSLWFHSRESVDSFPHSLLRTSKETAVLILTPTPHSGDLAKDSVSDFDRMRGEGKPNPVHSGEQL